MNDQSRDISALFDAAIEIESEQERREFLDRVCGDDAALKDQLERLLEANARADGFLSSPPPGLGETCVMPSEQDSQLEVRPGQGSVLDLIGQTVEGDLPRVVLESSPSEGVDPIVRPQSTEVPRGEQDSRYRLDGEIARGGMGAILKGRDTDLGRDLAVKVLLDEHREKPAVIQRFVEEAQIGGQLQHPGIVPVYELGQFEDKRPFFTMKLVKGKTLAALLGARKSPEQERAKLLGIFEQVCQTMAYAHSRGVIHRDLKPSNVMVGAFGEVQVMDWGLAKVLTDGGIADEKKAFENQTRTSIIQTIRSLGSDTPTGEAFGTVGSQTQMGSVMGTPAYMPPEQALGEIDRLDQRSDVFGLGAILCEILTGNPPYTGESHTEIYRKASRAKLEECHQRLAEHTGEEDGLREIVLAALEPEPEERIEDAGELAKQIGDYLESVDDRMRAAELQRVEADARATEERKRRRVIMALAASILVTCGVAGGGWLWVKQKDAQLAKVEAARRIEEMADRQQLTQQISGELSTARALAGLDEDTLPSQDAVDRASAAVNRAKALLETGEVDDAVREQASAVAADVKALQQDFALVAALDQAWQKEMDYQTQRANWERVNQNRGDANNAQGAMSTDSGATDDVTPDLFPVANPAENYERAFADWGLNLDKGKQDEQVKRLMALDAVLQPAVFSSLDRWRNLLDAPRKIEEWQQLQWKPLEPIAQKSNGRDSFKVLDDESILAGGPTPWAGYELVFETDVKEISALRLEAMLHDSLPNRGPGRQSQGRFRSQITVRCAPRDSPERVEKLKLGDGTADIQFRRAFVTRGHWHITAGLGRPHVAVYTCEETIQSDSGFRIWVSSPDRSRDLSGDSRWGRFRFSIPAVPDDLIFRQQQSDHLAKLIDAADNHPWRRDMRKEIANADVLGLISRAASTDTYAQSIETLIQLSEHLATRDNRQLVEHWPRDIEWQRLTNIKLESDSGTELAETEDGIILASGPNPLNETIRVKGKLPAMSITAIRLELIGNQQAKGAGLLGRKKHVALHDLQFQIGNDRRGFRRVNPSFVLSSQAHSTPQLREAIDDNSTTVFFVYDGDGRNRELVFAVDPQETAGESSLTLQMQSGANQGSNPIGLRLTVTGDEISIARVQNAALSLLERAVSSDPTEYRSRLALAQLLRRQLPPRFDEALRHATAAVALRPDATGGHAAILASLDVRNLTTGSASTAIALDHVEQLRELDARHPAIDALVRKVIQHGHQLADKKQMEHAAVAYRLALKLQTSNVVTYHSLISRLLNDGKYSLAHKSAQQAIEIDPTNATSHDWMGHVYYKQGNRVKAITWYRKATEADPGYINAYRNWANMLWGLQRLDKSIEVNERAIKIAPLDASLYDDLGLKLAAADKPDEAIAAYREAVQLAPYSLSYRNRLAHLLQRERRIDRAIEVWEEVIEIDPDGFTARNNLCVLLYREGRGERAIEEWQELVKLHPQEPIAHSNLAYLLEIHGHQEEARRAFEHGIESLPGDTFVRLKYASYLDRKEKLKEAIELYRTVIRINPRYAFAYHKLGELLERKGQIDEAIDLFKREIKELPQQVWPYQSLARLLRSQGRFDEVMPIFEKAYQDQPKNGNVLHSISQAISVDPEITAKQARWASELAHRAISVKTKWPYTYRVLGVLQYRTGEFSEAIESFDTFQRLEWERFEDRDKAYVSLEVAIALSFQSMAAFKLNDQDRAHHYLQQAEGAMGHRAFVTMPGDDELVPQVDDWNNWLLANARRSLDEARLLMELPTEFETDEILEKAIVAGRRYVDLHPQDSQSVLDLSLILAVANKDDERQQLFERAEQTLTEESSPNALSRIARGLLLAPCSDRKLTEKAAELARQSMKRAPSVQNNHWFRTTRGMADYRLGNHKETVEILTPVINWDADGRYMGDLALLYRSMALHRLGKPEEALADFRLAEQRLSQVPERESMHIEGLNGYKHIDTLAYWEARDTLGIETATESAEKVPN